MAYDNFGIVMPEHIIQFWTPIMSIYLKYILPTNFLKISPVSMSMVQAVKLNPMTMPTVLGLIMS